jgi:hypothetical protein
MHKVPQDVEAEDKFFGPLTFKQFLFGGGSLISGYVIFITVTKGIWPVAIVFLPFFIFFTALAFPWSKDQPTEIWLASRIRFFLVPHKRIWNQTGMKDLVTITVPKREVHVYSDGLSQDQVRSRFSALATVVDTRGWAVKNVMPAGAPAMTFAPRPTVVPSDRLVTAAPDITLNERTTLVESTQDIMDVQKSPVAQQFNTLIDQSTEKHRQETLAMIQQARHHTETQANGPMLPPVQVKQGEPKNTLGVSAQDLRFLKQPKKAKEPALAAFQDTATVLPGQTAPVAIGMGLPVTTVAKEDEDKLLDHVKKKKQQEREQRRHGHEKVLRPLAEIEEEERQRAEEQAKQDAQILQEQASSEAANQQAPTTSAAPVDPAILNLANNDDLNVETLARQAKRDKPEDPTEVIITLR